MEELEGSLEEVKKIAQARLGLQSNAFVLHCSTAFPIPLTTSLAWPSTPAMLVEMGCFFGVCATNTPAIIVVAFNGEIWEGDLYSGKYSR